MAQELTDTPEGCKPANVGVLLDMVKYDIDRHGENESFMIRVGLLRDILDELYDHRRWRNMR